MNDYGASTLLAYIATLPSSQKSVVNEINIDMIIGLDIFILIAIIFTICIFCSYIIRKSSDKDRKNKMFNDGSELQECKRGCIYFYE